MVSVCTVLCYCSLLVTSLPLLSLVISMRFSPKSSVSPSLPLFILFSLDFICLSIFSTLLISKSIFSSFHFFFRFASLIFYVHLSRYSPLFCLFYCFFFSERLFVSCLHIFFFVPVCFSSFILSSFCSVSLSLSFLSAFHLTLHSVQRLFIFDL